MTTLPTSKEFIEEFLRSATHSNGYCLQASNYDIARLALVLDAVIDMRIVTLLDTFKEKGLIT